MKKLLTILLALVASLCLFTACFESESTSEPESEVNSEVVSEPESEQQKPTTYTVTIAVNNAEWGTVSTNSVADVVEGTAITVEGNTLTIGETVVTATATANNADYEYAFIGYNGNPETVTEDVTVTAIFSQTQIVKVNYVINYYLQNESGEYVIDESLTETLSAVAGAYVELDEKKDVAGYAAIAHADEVLAGEVLEDGSFALAVYYDKYADYTVNYYLQELNGAYTLDEDRTYTENGVGEVSAEIPEIDGYTVNEFTSTAGIVKPDGSLVIDVYYNYTANGAVTWHSPAEISYNELASFSASAMTGELATVARPNTYYVTNEDASSVLRIFYTAGDVGKYLLVNVYREAIAGAEDLHIYAPDGTLDSTTIHSRFADYTKTGRDGWGANTDFEGLIGKWVTYVIYVNFPEEGADPRGMAFDLTISHYRAGSAYIGEYAFVTPEVLVTKYSAGTRVANYYKREFTGAYTLVATENLTVVNGAVTAPEKTIEGYTLNTQFSTTTMEVNDMFADVELNLFYGKEGDGVARWWSAAEVVQPDNMGSCKLSATGTVNERPGTYFLNNVVNSPQNPNNENKTACLKFDVSGVAAGTYYLCVNVYYHTLTNEQWIIQSVTGDISASVAERRYEDYTLGDIWAWATTRINLLKGQWITYVIKVVVSGEAGGTVYTTHFNGGQSTSLYVGECCLITEELYNATYGQHTNAYYG